MSEYQYDEFTAVDRPLTAREQAELWSLSTRADITATSFVSTYEWGNLKGDPRKLMEKYFDAHLYRRTAAPERSCCGCRNTCSILPSPPLLRQ